MIIYVVKNPDALTRAKCYSVPTPGAELMEEAEFIAWMDAQPEIVQASVPQVVTMRQFRRALIVSGINPNVVAQTITAAIPDALQCALAQSDWEFATEVHRDNPLVAAVGAALGKSSAEVDAIFTLAATFAA